MNGLALLPPSDATKMKKQTKITIASISIVVALLISLPVSLFVADAVTGDVYSKSYYAEWSKMYSRLKSAKGRKIVFLGNSAVAFGINSKLIQDELAADGLEYETVNFGLYGALGTKFMLDFSLNHIGKGDIVIVMPEEYPQSMSLYESPTENWKAFEGDRSAFGEVPYANKGSYIGAYINYVVGKRAIAGKDNVTGVYALSSFDERCDMTFERKENEMLPYYRALGDDIVFDDSLFDPAFVSYLNTYGDKVKFNAYYAKPTGEGMTVTHKDANDKTLTDFQHDRAWGINATAALGKNVDLTLGYDDFRDGSSYDKDNKRKKWEFGGESKIFNVGLKYKAKDFSLGATYLHTNGGPLDDWGDTETNENGFYVAANYKGADKAKVGSWGIGVKYYHMPAGLPGNNWATGNALGKTKQTVDGTEYTVNKSLLFEGYKGWYAGANVTVAKNMIAGIQYWDLKGRESNVKNKALWTDLVVTF